MGRVAISAQDFKLVCSFETVRETLLRDRYSDRLAKPLAYWALPNDRRLPLAFLSRSIGELVNTPFEELSATPGIGQKKISSLVKLLMRATRDQPPAVPFGLADLADERGLEPNIAGAPFDAFMVSEGPARRCAFRFPARRRDEASGGIAGATRTVGTGGSLTQRTYVERSVCGRSVTHGAECYARRG